MDSRLNPDSEVTFVNFGICRVKRGRAATCRGTNLLLCRWRGFDLSLAGSRWVRNDRRLYFEDRARGGEAF
jgi:hypothetical protein